MILSAIYKSHPNYYSDSFANNSATEETAQSLTTVLIRGVPPLCPGNIFLVGDPAKRASKSIELLSNNCPITFLPSLSMSGMGLAVIWNALAYASSSFPSTTPPP
mmetsp:Transcript_11719/g.24977  ORF Transcript_11719/g.24977 Transcript_11719/m.24977 type:complete len:105 (+) Transcript_11719:69-383(+)